jgi:predicted ATPase/DNA-binding SARP family transcriptional activator
VEIGVLGPLLLLADDGEPVVQRSALQRLLLAVLIAGRRRILQLDELAESLWADALPADPAGALHSQVSRLRRQLGPASSWIETVSAGYRLVCPPDRLDATRFERHLADARQVEDEPAVALERLDRALALWRGRAFQELADRPSIAPEATRLDELRNEAAELRADTLLKVGRSAEAASAMHLLMADHPFRERPVALVMRALTAQGRHADALREFEGFRRLLGDELGLEPSPELRAVEATILRHEARTQPLMPAVGVPGNSFVGRAAEVAKVEWLLERSRLVTLTGPGGVGKTRIALHVAAGARAAYPDGVYLCELARISDPDAVAATLASVLRVEQLAEHSLVERVVEFLLVKRALLVIDNCEHVLPAAAELVTAVLLRTPYIDVLATSRERLGVDGEQRVPVGPLPIPAWDDPGAPSAVLFMDRARAVRPDYTLPADDVATVSELCRRLDGLPLAIELAAAQTVSVSPSEILAAVSDRLVALADSRRTVERHRSLDAVFGWSFGLLTEAERQVFERLAVFAGGWTTAAAGDVADATPADLAALVERSLVTPQYGRDVRFSMLEPVRQFAEARLADRCEVEHARRRHAAWAVEFAEAANAGLCGPDERGWRARMDTELDNLRAAHRWCLDHDPELSIRLAGSLYRYTWSGARSEVSTWATQAVSRFPDLAHVRLPAAYAVAALGLCIGGDLGAARALAEAALTTVPGDPISARFAWEVLGEIETWLGNFDRAVPFYDRAIGLARLAGDDHQAAICLFDRALCSAYSGRPDEAIAQCGSAAALVGAVRNPSLDAWSDYINGEVRLDCAPLEALPYLRRSVAAARRIGNRTITGLAGLSAVSIEARVGDPLQALSQYGDLIDHWDREGAWNMQWTTLRTLIELLARLGRDAEAALLYGALTASATASPLAGADAERITEAVAAMRARLGDERFEAKRAKGAALSDSEAVAFALECVGGRSGGLPRAGDRPVSELTAH